MAPTYASEFGTEGAALSHPVSDAIDSSGNVWVTSNEGDLIKKFSSTGTLLGTYGSKGAAEDQFMNPWGIALDPRNGNVYVSDQGNNRIEEFSSSGAFLKTFGWGVGKAGKTEFEICRKNINQALPVVETDS